MKATSALILSAVALLAGCASIVNGQNQSVSVEARHDSELVPAATCTLTNNKGTWFLSTPGSTMVQRSYEDLNVRCEKVGLDPGLVQVKSSTKAMVAGNILFGGVIGLGVDAATGAAYDYPTLITVYMGRTVPSSTATPTPAAAPVAVPAAPVAAVAPAASAAASSPGNGAGKLQAP